MDTNVLFTKVLNNPATFPQTAIYTNTTGSCEAYANNLTITENSFEPSCGVPVKDYFWLKTVHPTYPIHDVLAEQVVKLLGNESRGR